MPEANTCWSPIRDAARGIDRATQEFALEYEPVLRAYLGARWRRRAFFYGVARPVARRQPERAAEHVEDALVHKQSP